MSLKPVDLTPIPEEKARVAKAAFPSRCNYQIDLLGPVVEEPSWHAKIGKGFAVSDFEIDWENRRAICPEGKVSGGWREARAVYGMEIVYIDFLKRGCSVCPRYVILRRPRLERRTITVNAQPNHEALQEARSRQQAPDFKKQYQARAGIEGTISQAVRVTDLRKARFSVSPSGQPRLRRLTARTHSSR